MRSKRSRVSGPPVRGSRSDAFARDDKQALTFPLAIAHLSIDQSSPLPIHEQICQAIRTAVWSRELPSGTLLPTSKELAKHLNVARNTVVFAYAKLVAEGICVSNTRRGTRVAAQLLHRSHLADEASTRSVPGEFVSLRAAFNAHHLLEARVDRVAGGVPFVLYASDPMLYPRTKLGRRFADKFLLAAPAVHLSSDSAHDLTHFQRSIASYLRHARGVVCEPSQVIPICGLESALNLTARVLIDPGDSVAVEDPAMDVVHSAFASTRANLHPIPCDAYGADPKRMSGPPARVMFVSPSVNFPFGVQMPEKRRLEILEAARAQNAIVLENDTYGQLRYSGSCLRSIQGLDTDGRVIHFGSFFETLGNHVNVGYLVVPTSLRDCFAEVKRRISNVLAPPVLDAIAEFIDEHQYALHARNVRNLYAKRLDLAKRACRARFSKLSVSEPQGGLHLVLQCAQGRINEASICAAAAAEDLPVRALSHYFLRKGESRGLVLGLGGVPESGVQSLIDRLSCLLAPTRPAGLERMSA